MVKLLPENWYDVGLELCVRVKEDQDKDFITRLKADSEKLYRVGNVFIAEVRSFDDIRRNYQQSQTNSMRSYILGMVFLLLNIFLGLLGTFWFRTQQRRGEIALMKSLGGTDHSVFVRQLVEGLLLLVIATIPAVFINWNLANSELNAWMNGTTIEGGRFIITVLISFILIALMIVVGIWIPARKAMKVQPAEALHNE
jgi:putative ABC transport system permease protein